MDFDPTSSPTPSVDDVANAVGTGIMMLLGCGFVTLLLIAAAVVTVILIVRRNKSHTVMLRVLSVRDDDQSALVGRVIVEAQPHWITVPPSQASAFRWHQQNGAPAPCVVYPNRKDAGGIMQGQLTTPPQQQPLQQF